jgi:hypothetical protein
VHFDFSAVPLTGTSLNESARLAARRERNHAMRLRLQAFSKFTVIGECASWKAFDVKKQQVLKWCYAVRSSRSPRESLDSAHLVTKVGQLLESVLRKRRIVRSSHLFTPIHSKAASIS